MPAKPQTQEALDKAARAMESAGKALQEKKGNDAVPEQDQAIKSLAEAKKQLGEQMAEVQKRTEKLPEALENARKNLQITNDLLQKDPENELLQIDHVPVQRIGRTPFLHGIFTQST